MMQLLFFLEQAIIDADCIILEEQNFEEVIEENEQCTTFHIGQNIVNSITKSIDGRDFNIDGHFNKLTFNTEESMFTDTSLEMNIRDSYFSVQLMGNAEAFIAKIRDSLIDNAVFALVDDSRSADVSIFGTIENCKFINCRFLFNNENLVNNNVYYLANNMMNTTFSNCSFELVLNQISSFYSLSKNYFFDDSLFSNVNISTIVYDSEYSGLALQISPMEVENTKYRGLHIENTRFETALGKSQFTYICRTFSNSLVMENTNFSVSSKESVKTTMNGLVEYMSGEQHVANIIYTINTINSGDIYLLYQELSNNGKNDNVIEDIVVNFENENAECYLIYRLDNLFSVLDEETKMTKLDSLTLNIKNSIEPTALAYSVNYTSFENITILSESERPSMNNYLPCLSYNSSFTGLYIDIIAYSSEKLTIISSAERCSYKLVKINFSAEYYNSIFFGIAEQVFKCNISEYYFNTSTSLLSVVAIAEEFIGENSKIENMFSNWLLLTLGKNIEFSGVQINSSEGLQAGVVETCENCEFDNIVSNFSTTVYYDKISAVVSACSVNCVFSRVSVQMQVKIGNYESSIIGGLCGECENITAIECNIYAKILLEEGYYAEVGAIVGVIAAGNFTLRDIYLQLIAKENEPNCFTFVGQYDNSMADGANIVNEISYIIDYSVNSCEKVSIDTSYYKPNNFKFWAKTLVFSDIVCVDEKDEFCNSHSRNLEGSQIKEIEEMKFFVRNDTCKEFSEEIATPCYCVNEDAECGELHFCSNITFKCEVIGNCPIGTCIEGLCKCGSSHCHDEQYCDGETCTDIMECKFEDTVLEEVCFCADDRNYLCQQGDRCHGGKCIPERICESIEGNCECYSAGASQFEHCNELQKCDFVTGECINKECLVNVILPTEGQILLYNALDFSNFVTDDKYLNYLHEQSLLTTSNEYFVEELLAPCYCHNTICNPNELCTFDGNCKEVDACLQSVLITDVCICGNEYCYKDSICQASDCVPQEKCNNRDIIKKACECGDNSCEIGQSCVNDECKTIDDIICDEDVENLSPCNCNLNSCLNQNLCETIQYFDYACEISDCDTDILLETPFCKCGSKYCKENTYCHNNECLSNCLEDSILQQGCFCGDLFCGKNSICNSTIGCEAAVECDASTVSDCICGRTICENSAECQDTHICNKLPTCLTNEVTDQLCDCGGKRCLFGEICYNNECFDKENCLTVESNLEPCVCDELITFKSYCILAASQNNICISEICETNHNLKENCICQNEICNYKSEYCAEFGGCVDLGDCNEDNDVPCLCNSISCISPSSCVNEGTNGLQCYEDECQINQYLIGNCLCGKERCPAEHYCDEYYECEKVEDCSDKITELCLAEECDETECNIAEKCFLSTELENELCIKENCELEINVLQKCYCGNVLCDVNHYCNKEEECIEIINCNDVENDIMCSCQGVLCKNNLYCEDNICLSDCELNSVLEERCICLEGVCNTNEYCDGTQCLPFSSCQDEALSPCLCATEQCPSRVNCIEGHCYHDCIGDELLDSQCICVSEMCQPNEFCSYDDSACHDLPECSINTFTGLPCISPDIEYCNKEELWTGLLCENAEECPENEKDYCMINEVMCKSAFYSVKEERCVDNLCDSTGVLIRDCIVDNTLCLASTSYYDTDLNKCMTLEDCSLTIGVCECDGTPCQSNLLCKNELCIEKECIRNAVLLETCLCGQYVCGNGYYCSLDKLCVELESCEDITSGVCKCGEAPCSSPDICREDDSYELFCVENECAFNAIIEYSPCECESQECQVEEYCSADSLTCESITTECDTLSDLEIGLPCKCQATDSEVFSYCQSKDLCLPNGQCITEICSTNEAIVNVCECGLISCGINYYCNDQEQCIFINSCDENRQNANMCICGDLTCEPNEICLHQDIVFSCEASCQKNTVEENCYCGITKCTEGQYCAEFGGCVDLGDCNEDNDVPCLCKSLPYSEEFGSELKCASNEECLQEKPMKYIIQENICDINVKLPGLCACGNHECRENQYCSTDLECIDLRYCNQTSFDTPCICDSSYCPYTDICEQEFSYEKQECTNIPLEEQCKAYAIMESGEQCYCNEEEEPCGESHYCDRQQKCHSIDAYDRCGDTEEILFSPCYCKEVLCLVGQICAGDECIQDSCNFDEILGIKCICKEKLCEENEICSSASEDCHSALDSCNNLISTNCKCSGAQCTKNNYCRNNMCIAMESCNVNEINAYPCLCGIRQGICNAGSYCDGYSCQELQLCQVNAILSVPCFCYSKREPCSATEFCSISHECKNIETCRSKNTELLELCKCKASDSSPCAIGRYCNSLNKCINQCVNNSYTWQECLCYKSKATEEVCYFNQFCKSGKCSDYYSKCTANSFVTSECLCNKDISLCESGSFCGSECFDMYSGLKYSQYVSLSWVQNNSFNPIISGIINYDFDLQKFYIMQEEEEYTEVLDSENRYYVSSLPNLFKYPGRGELYDPYGKKQCFEEFNEDTKCSEIIQEEHCYTKCPMDQTDEDNESQCKVGVCEGICKNDKCICNYEWNLENPANYFNKTILVDYLLGDLCEVQVCHCLFGEICYFDPEIEFHRCKTNTADSQYQSEEYDVCTNGCPDETTFDCYQRKCSGHGLCLNKQCVNNDDMAIWVNEYKNFYVPLNTTDVGDCYDKVNWNARNYNNSGNTTVKRSCRSCLDPNSFGPSCDICIEYDSLLQHDSVCHERVDLPHWCFVRENMILNDPNDSLGDADDKVISLAENERYENSKGGIVGSSSHDGFTIFPNKFDEKYFCFECLGDEYDKIDDICYLRCLEGECLFGECHYLNRKADITSNLTNINYFCDQDSCKCYQYQQADGSKCDQYYVLGYDYSDRQKCVVDLGDEHGLCYYVNNYHRCICNNQTIDDSGNLIAPNYYYELTSCYEQCYPEHMVQFPNYPICSFGNCYLYETKTSYFCSSCFTNSSGEECTVCPIGQVQDEHYCYENSDSNGNDCYLRDDGSGQQQYCVKCATDYVLYEHHCYLKCTQGICQNGDCYYLNESATDFNCSACYISNLAIIKNELKKCYTIIDNLYGDCIRDEEGIVECSCFEGFAGVMCRDVMNGIWVGDIAYLKVPGYNGECYKSFISTEVICTSCDRGYTLPLCYGCAYGYALDSSLKCTKCINDFVLSGDTGDESLAALIGDNACVKRIGNFEHGICYNHESKIICSTCYQGYNKETNCEYCLPGYTKSGVFCVQGEMQCGITHYSNKEVFICPGCNRGMNQFCTNCKADEILAEDECYERSTIAKGECYEIGSSVNCISGNYCMEGRINITDYLRINCSQCQSSVFTINGSCHRQLGIEDIYYHGQCYQELLYDQKIACNRCTKPWEGFMCHECDTQHTVCDCEDSPGEKCCCKRIDQKTGICYLKGGQKVCIECQVGYRQQDGICAFTGSNSSILIYLIILAIIALAVLIVSVAYLRQPPYKQFLIKRRMRFALKSTGMYVVFTVLAQICSLIIAVEDVYIDSIEFQFGVIFVAAIPFTAWFALFQLPRHRYFVFLQKLDFVKFAMTSLIEMIFNFLLYYCIPEELGVGQSIFKAMAAPACLLAFVVFSNYRFTRNQIIYAVLASVFPIIYQLSKSIMDAEIPGYFIGLEIGQVELGLFAIFCNILVLTMQMFAFEVLLRRYEELEALCLVSCFQFVFYGVSMLFYVQALTSVAASLPFLICVLMQICQNILQIFIMAGISSVEYAINTVSSAVIVELIQAIGSYILASNTGAHSNVSEIILTAIAYFIVILCLIAFSFLHNPILKKWQPYVVERPNGVKPMIFKNNDLREQLKEGEYLDPILLQKTGYFKQRKMLVELQKKQKARQELVKRNEPKQLMINDILEKLNPGRKSELKPIKIGNRQLLVRFDDQEAEEDKSLL